MNDITSSNIVVLVDPYTRKSVESITYESLVRHVLVITDIREITAAHYGCDFVMFETAVPSAVTPEILREFIDTYNIKTHLIYSTDAIGSIFSTLGVKCVKADCRMLEWNLIYAVIHGDSAILAHYQKSQIEARDFSDSLENLPDSLVAPVNRLYTSYVDLAGAYSRLIEENARLSETVENYHSVGRKTVRAIEELNDLLEKATAENRTYSAMLSQSYDVVFNGVYPERPRVLYIKSISHLAGIDNLLMLLYSVLTRQYKVSCKIVKLVDNTNATSIRYIPNVYTPIHDSYNTEIVLTNDFLASLSGYNMLMSLLMMNRSGLDFLIIHDLRGTLNTAIDSSLIDLQLNEMSGDYAVLAEYENVLSDLEDHAPFVWNFKQVAEYTGTNVIKLTSHPTVSKILDHLM